MLTRTRSSSVALRFWLILLSCACAAGGAEISEWDLTYVGDSMLPGHLHDVPAVPSSSWTQDRFDPKATFFVTGGVLTIQLRVADAASDGAALRVPIKPFDGTGGLAHTIDVVAARPLNYWKGMPPTGRGVGWSVSVPIDAASCKRYDVYLGDAGAASDAMLLDQITIAVATADKYATPEFQKIRVPGLNVEQMNHYRTTMSSSGELRIYINDISEPVYASAELASVRDSGNIASFGLLAPRVSGDRYGLANLQLDVDEIHIDASRGRSSPPGKLPQSRDVQAAPVDGGSTILASGGQATCRIVIPADANEFDRFAARELKEHLQRIIGDRVETTAQAGACANLWVGTSPQVRQILPDVDWNELGPDGIVIRTVGRDLILSGGGARGTIYAVCTFLEEVIGCRWWSNDAEYVPSKPDLSVPAQNIAYRPAFDLRHLRTAPLHDKELAWRMRQNGNFVDFDTGDHTITRLLPASEHFVAHPEWFMYCPDDGDPANKYSYVNGLRYVKETRPAEWYPVAEKNRRLPWQPCISHPEARKAIVAAALKDLEHAYPDFRSSPKVIWVSQQDGGWFCRCERCESLRQREGSESATWIELVNQVAEEVEKRHADVLVATLAYLQTEAPPKTIRPRSNVVIYPAFLDRNHRLPIGELGGPSKNLRSWCNVASNVYVWDYDTNFRNWLTVYPQYFTTTQSLRFFHKLGVKGAMIQGSAGNDVEFQRMRAYVVAHMMWNPDLDDRKLMTEFLDGYYGAAGAHLLKCIDRLVAAAGRKSDFFLSCYAGSTEGWLTLDDLSAVTRLFDEAAGAVRDDPKLLKRVQRARTSIDLVWLERYDALRREAQKRKMAFLGPADPIAAIHPFLSDSYGFETYGENRPYSDFAHALRNLDFENGEDDHQIRGTD